MRERLTRYPFFAFLARVKIGLRLMSLTTEPLRFLVGEVAARPGVSVYTLRRPGAPKVAVRHGLPDVRSMHQIFLQQHEGEPADAAAAVAALGRPPRVLDIGGNIGMWSAWAAAHWPGADVTAVEPDPGNLVVLRAAAAEGGWAVVAEAAGTAGGTMRFHAGRFGMSRAMAPGDDAADVIDVPVRDVFELTPGKDILKIDIEGGEWAILADPRLAKVDAALVYLEYHGHMAPGPDTHGTARRLLESAGFETLRVPHVAGAPADEGVLWAWRLV